MMVAKIRLKIEDEDSYLEYNEIWNKIKKTLNIRFHSQPIYDDKYMKTEVKTFGGIINTLFSDNKTPKDGNHFICIAAIYIYSKVDKNKSILKVDKKNYPQVYPQQYKTR